jgi:Type I phosphodiesterase / nucleotide pyrophosphatase
VSPPEPHDLERVRSELKRLGYLSHGFERFLLQDALRPRRPGLDLLRLTAKVGVGAGLALAAPLAVALAAANNAPAADLLPLFLHLLPPIGFGVAVAFLALCALLVLLLRLTHVRRIEALSFAAAAAAGVAALALAARWAGEFLAGGPAWHLALFVLGAAAALYLLVRLVHFGLLTLAIQLTDAPPRGRLVSGRRLGLAVLAAAGLLLLPALLAARGAGETRPGALPTAPGERVLLLGIDGVLAEELEYLLARGDLPALARLAREGAVLRYARPPEVPAAFWTSVSTGLPSPEHGVAALDSFQPLGTRTPLARSGPLRAYWSGVAVPLGLARHRAVLANRRRAFTVWELASRGGAPVAAVDWWGTYPAAKLPGTVVAHGAYHLLRQGVPGAVSPPAAASRLRPLLAAGAAPEERRLLAAALPRAVAASVLDRALLPDRFYRRAFAALLAERPRAAALYLPGLDIAADNWQGGGVAFADLVRRELAETDALLGAALVAEESGVGTVAVVVDPGRRRLDGEGRVLLWRRRGCPPTRAKVAPEAVASALLRALGLPQSDELPNPPPTCRWPPPPARVATYGTPGDRAATTREGEEYLEGLRALGYL